MKEIDRLCNILITTNSILLSIRDELKKYNEIHK